VSFATGGFFIHAIVNTLARRYAALDPSRRTTQIIRALEGRKQRKEVDLKAELEKKGDDIKKKRSRKQGRPSDETASLPVTQPNQEIVDAANMFLELLQRTLKSADLEEEGEGDESSYDGSVFPDIRMVDCTECNASMQKDDIKVPDIFLPLHKLLCHHDVGDKFDGSKKQKTNN